MSNLAEEARAHVAAMKRFGIVAQASTGGSKTDFELLEGLAAEIERLRTALDEIADCERRNGMVLSGYEAVAIARRALNHEQSSGTK